MQKFMVSLRDENFQLLIFEAAERGISLQELLRAVIIPDWVKFNTQSNPSSKKTISVRPSQMISKEKEVHTVVNHIKG